MKKLTTAIMAIASIAGIGGAFANVNAKLAPFGYRYAADGVTVVTIDLGETTPTWRCTSSNDICYYKNYDPSQPEGEQLSNPTNGHFTSLN